MAAWIARRCCQRCSRLAAETAGRSRQHREKADWELRQLRCAGRDVSAATGKGSDGIVSRYVNRPISRATSYQLLRLPGVPPLHASLGTALLGLMMAAALFFCGQTGLIAGALLFRAASIFDGVDGEIARATYRTSHEGATLDSVIEAATKLAFISGVSVNVALIGDTAGACAGGLALGTLATGLLLVGRHAKRHGRTDELRRDQTPFPPRTTAIAFDGMPDPPNDPRLLCRGLRGHGRRWLRPPSAPGFRYDRYGLARGDRSGACSGQTACRSRELRIHWPAHCHSLTTSI